MKTPFMRIPYTDSLPAPTIIPRNAVSLSGALTALRAFLTAPSTSGSRTPGAVVLTGAGISVASGLADYRGTKGTYRLNKTYRPIYYPEFLKSHEARKRESSCLSIKKLENSSWTTLHKAKPNATHYAVKDLSDLGLVRSVITQNVDSFHSRVGMQIPTVELHGYLRSCICTSCHQELSRDVFQQELARLNPAWSDLLQQILASGALDTENPDERRARGMKVNPDGDVDLPGASYRTFRYPSCPKCLANPPVLDGTLASVQVDSDGAWQSNSMAGILKPAVVMFGESIRGVVKTDAERAIDNADRLLVMGTSLATYSAWRLAQRAKDQGMPIAVINLGGVRGEDALFAGLDPDQRGELGTRVELPTDELLPAVVEMLQQH
ncbi:DHS-like NAD/FAD-binding domain-containing protein [Xylariaceae sp. FL1272]|nr:DHS-like NAD/FAD-binding domain-containing protein [Xylariaceae sp. FL1272]